MNTSLMNGGNGASGGAEAKVSVAVRVRPLIERETKQKEGSGINWVVDQNFIQQASPNTDEALPGVMPYMFDHVFSMEDDTKEVYNTVVSPIVDQAFSGFNGTVLCYGQTSSGKTFTLYGSERENGILSLTARHLFKRISEDKDRTYMVRLGLIEIYNEKVSDLISAQQKEITIVEKNGCIVPKELEEIEIFKPEDMLAAMQQVQKRRRVGETRMNQDSSRSHTIMRILLESVPKAEEIQENVKVTVTTALLNFVDLAGSEKASQTCSFGERFKEATHINRSLSVLSQVVMQLSQDEPITTSGSHLPPSVTPGMSKVGSSITNVCSSSTTKKTTSKYVNYRDSKLTRILQSSLSGNAYIAMICTVTPASIEETISTLRFARTAKKIQTKPKANHKLASDSEYQQKILDLQQTLDSKTYELQSKTNEVDDLKRRLEIFMKFSAHPRVLESQNPSGQVMPTLDMRRKTICSSLLPRRDQITLPCLSLQSITEDGIFQIPNKPPPLSKKRSSCGDFSSPFQSEKFMTDEQARNLLDKGEKTRLEDTFTCSTVTKKPKYIQTCDAESQTDPEPYIPEAKRLRLEGTHPAGTPPSVLRLQRSHLRLACEEEIREKAELKAFHSREIDVLQQQVSILEEALAMSEAKCKEMQEIFEVFSDGNFSALLTELKNSIERETQDAFTETEETEKESRQVERYEFGVMVGVPMGRITHSSTETGSVELRDFGATVGTSLLNLRDSWTETAKIEQQDFGAMAFVPPGMLAVASTAEVSTNTAKILTQEVGMLAVATTFERSTETAKIETKDFGVTALILPSTCETATETKVQSRDSGVMAVAATSECSTETIRVGTKHPASITTIRTCDSSTATIPVEAVKVCEAATETTFTEAGQGQGHVSTAATATQAQAPRRTVNRDAQTMEDSDYNTLVKSCHNERLKRKTLQAAMGSAARKFDAKLEVEKKRIAELEKQMALKESEKENLQHQITVIEKEYREQKPKSSKEIQCDVMKGQLEKATQGTKGMLPEGYPKVDLMASEISSLKRELYVSALDRQKKAKEEEAMMRQIGHAQNTGQQFFKKSDLLIDKEAEEKSKARAASLNVNERRVLRSTTRATRSILAPSSESRLNEPPLVFASSSSSEDITTKQNAFGPDNHLVEPHAKLQKKTYTKAEDVSKMEDSNPARPVKPVSIRSFSGSGRPGPKLPSDYEKLFEDF